MRLHLFIAVLAGAAWSCGSAGSVPGSPSPSGSPLPGASPSFAPPVTVDAVRIESPRVFHARTERGQRFLAAAYRRYGKRIPRAWIEIVRRFEVLHFGRAACAAKMRNLEYRWRRREY